MARNPMISAFGETKTAKDWINDSRCKGRNKESIYQRIFELGWLAEKAISTLPQREYKKPIPLKKGNIFGYFKLTGLFKCENNIRYAECQCVCGTIVYKRVRHLRSGLKIKRSCGCIKIYADHGSVKHGLSRSYNGKKHPIYSIWCCMRDRCFNRKNQSYPDYGGRGIGILFNDFFDFYDWAINNGWKKGLTIERRVVNSHYSRENCKWITISEQQKNKRNTIRVSAFGITKTLPDWVKDKRCVRSYSSLYDAIVNRKINPQKAIMNKIWHKRIKVV